MDINSLPVQETLENGRGRASVKLSSWNKQKFVVL